MAEFLDTNVTIGLTEEEVSRTPSPSSESDRENLSEAHHLDHFLAQIQKQMSSMSDATAKQMSSMSSHLQNSFVQQMSNMSDMTAHQISNVADTTARQLSNNSDTTARQISELSKNISKMSNKIQQLEIKTTTIS